MKQAFLSPQAEIDLGDIWFYIAQDNIDEADHFISHLLERCQKLAEYPGIGRQRPELAPSLRSLPVGNYILFYQSIRNGINVVRILNGSRDLPSMF